MELEPILLALTSEAKDSIQGEKIIVSEFPFKIGRESRVGQVKGAMQFVERRATSFPPKNSYYLVDNGDRLNISREHFQIEKTEDGKFELIDRKSTCGTIVDGQVVGGQGEGGKCPLKNGSKIVLGSSQSLFTFEFKTS